MASGAETHVNLGVGDAMRRYWFLVVACVVVATAVAIYSEAIRDSTYTATTNVAVGRIDVSNPGALAGFSLATQTLAQSYARAIVADEIRRDVARRTGLKEGTIRADLRASAIPESSVIRITGESVDEEQAIRIANEGSAALIAYVARINRNNPDSERLYREFRAASLQVSNARAAERRAERRLEATGSEEAARALRSARVARDSAELRRETVRQAYATTQQGQASTSLLQLLNRASSATSDSRSRLQLALFIGVFAGLALGAALAIMRARRLNRLRSA